MSWTSALAQTTDADWQTAIRALKNEEWKTAASRLQPFVPTSPGAMGRFSPRAEYYYSLALLRGGKPDQALPVAQALLGKSSDSRTRQEAQYLLGNILFELGRYTPAVTYLQRIKSEPLASQAQAMQLNYLKKAPADTLRKLTALTPTAVQLASGGSATAVDTAGRKGVYRVGILLPFHLDAAAMKSNSRKDQIALDLYTGMAEAVAELNASKPVIELYSFNTDKSPERINELVQLPELRGMNLLIGPLYSQGAEQVAAFAQQNQIPLVNPLGNKFIWEDGKSFAYHAEPVAETRGREAARLFLRKGIRKAVIYQGPEMADSLLVSGFLVGGKEGGMQILKRRSLQPGKGPALTGELKSLGVDSTCVVLIASDAGSIMNNVLAQVRQAQVRPAILAYEDMMTSGRFLLADLAKQNVYVIAPYYCNNLSAEFHQFREQYVKRYHISPSVYALKGYDLMLYLGRRLQETGGQPGQGLTSEARHGSKFCGSYQFKPGLQDNQVVPIYRVDVGGPVAAE